MYCALIGIIMFHCLLSMLLLLLLYGVELLQDQMTTLVILLELTSNNVVLKILLQARLINYIS